MKMFVFKSYKILIAFHSLNILASQPNLVDLIKLKEHDSESLNAPVN